MQPNSSFYANNREIAVGQEGHLVPVDSFGNIYRFYRGQFNAAGQNSYDSPPTQDQDAFIVLSNTLPVTRGSLERRWGLGNRFTAPQVSTNRILEYTTLSGDHSLITANRLQATMTSEDYSTNTINPMFTYATQSVTPRFLVSRNYVYCFGPDGIRLKHSGVIGDTQQNIGIAAAETGSNSSSAKFPTAAVNYNNGHTAWLNPTFIEANDGNFVSCTVAAPPTGGLSLSQGLDCSNFVFSVTPGTEILGIAVVLGGAAKIGSSTATTITAQLLRSSSPTGVVKRSPALTTTPTNYTLGGASDLWGTSFNTGDTNATTFGVRLIANNTDSGSTPSDGAQQNYVTIKVYFKVPFTVGAPAAGDITLLSGRIYTIVGKNSTTGHHSDLSEFSQTTGVITSKEIPLSALPVWTDSQVDQKVLLATADGGDLTKLYEVAILANATTTYTDDTTEIQLLLNNVYQETDDEGIEHGVAENTPPPTTGSIICKHRGRVYMLVGNTLYFTKNTDELTTSTGLITGKYEEAWPGDFQMDVSEQAEEGSALFSDGLILYIATERHIRKLLGDGPQNFDKPEIHFNELGVLTQETVKVVAVEGQPAGIMWLTPDLKVMFSDFNTYANVGRDIQDLLNTINRNGTDFIRASYFGEGVYSFYTLAIPAGNPLLPNTVCVYDLNKRKWHVWTFPVNVNIMELCFDYKSDGTPRFLVGISDTTGGAHYYVMEFDPTLSQDVMPSPDTTHNITCIAQSTWQHFSDPTSRKDFNEIEVMTTDTSMTFAMVGASNADEFNTPTSLITNQTLVTSPFGERKLYMAGVGTRDRFYRMTFTSSANSRAFIEALSAEVVQEHKF